MLERILLALVLGIIAWETGLHAQSGNSNATMYGTVFSFVFIIWTIITMENDESNASFASRKELPRLWVVVFPAVFIITALWPW